VRRSPAALVLVLVLAGCGGDGGSDASARATDAPSSGAASARSLGDVTVLAASSLTEAFTTLGEQLEADHPGTRVRFSFAASSELATQITQGAPADVFASASPATMEQVVDAGAVAGEPEVFVRNRLQIAVPADNPAGVKGIEDFGRQDLTIALCAPEVPCGDAAARAFEAAGVTAQPDTLEADVKAALSKVILGEVDAAMVYRTDVLAAGDKVDGLDFPESADAVNDYPIAVLGDAPNPAGAKAFVDLVRSGTGLAVLAEAGFEQP
jgi:molybdate transport system substrate-binding protein